MTEPKQTGHLLRVLGVVFGLSVTIGGTIGMGILRTPGEVAKQLPTPTLFIGIWIVGGLYALLGAISVAELGAMIHRSGGFYVFAHRALGNYAGGERSGRIRHGCPAVACEHSRSARPRRRECRARGRN